MSRWATTRRYIARVLIVVYTMGCYSWHSPKPTTPRDLIAEKHPDRIRLTLCDGRSVVLHQPPTRGDSLGGVAFFQFEQGGVLRDTLALHVSDVVKAEIQGVEAVGTTAIIVGGFVLVLGAAAAIARSSADTRCGDPTANVY
jgi:hypothetical protein